MKRGGLFLRRLQREIGYDDCMGMAAQIAFFLMMGLFPFLIFLLSLISYLPLGHDLTEQILTALSEQLPAEAYHEVAGTVMSLIPSGNAGLLSFGLLAAIWSGSMGVGALITTVNRAYNIRPRRSLATQKVLSIALMLVLSALWLLATVFILFGPKVTHTVFQWFGLAGDAQNLWTTLRLPLVFLLNLSALALLYYYGPEARQEFRWILPGAITSTILWLGASSLFRLFVRNFASYNTTYGSLTGVIILMIWLWISGLIFLLGAEINALMKRLEQEDGPQRVRPLR
ncbi:MAG: YihY/virulence factor BrkB family protein [bacterium]